MKSSKFYAVEADEVTDTSNWEQLGVVLRYIQNDEAKERLIAFTECEGIRGEDLFRSLVDVLSSAGLNLQLCRAQAYDGAGNMAGRMRGCQALFLDAYPLAKFYHCASHQLNLALTHSCKSTEIHSMMASLKSVGLFFQYSPKRQRQLERSIEEENDEATELVRTKKVKTLCETRWVERHTALSDFSNLYPAVLSCLDKIAGNEGSLWDGKSVTDASGLSHATTSDGFIAAFQTALYFSSYLKALTVLLQGSSLDVLVAYDEVHLVRKTLQDIRSEAVKEFEPVYADMLKMATVAGRPELSVPRTCRRQTQRSNVPAETPKDYWRRSVFLPFLDHLLTELSSRFSAMTKAAVGGLRLLPEKAKTMDVERVRADLLQAYEVDLPEAEHLDAELRVWKTKWSSVPSEIKVPSTVEDTLKSVSGQELLFPNVLQVLKLLLVTPVTTASVERANSALGFVKSDHRSTMSEGRLNALLRLYVHKDIHLDFEEVVTAYGQKHPRRMLLGRPLDA